MKGETRRANNILPFDGKIKNSLLCFKSNVKEEEEEERRRKKT